MEGPEGGFYLFPNFELMKDDLTRHGITTSNQLCERILMETGVAMLPGTDFGREPHELYLRLAYVDFDGQKALDLVDSIVQDDSESVEKFMDFACPNVKTAIEKVCSWVQSIQDKQQVNASC